MRYTSTPPAVGFLGVVLEAEGTKVGSKHRCIDVERFPEYFHLRAVGARRKFIDDCVSYTIKVKKRVGQHVIHTLHRKKE